MTDKEREALMRLTMCARCHCSVCKFKSVYTWNDCQAEITSNMVILSDALERKEE